MALERGPAARTATSVPPTPNAPRVTISISEASTSATVSTLHPRLRTLSEQSLPQARRVLHRAANLQTPNGKPVRAIEEVVLQQLAPESSLGLLLPPTNPGSPPAKATSLRRAHSSSVPATSARPQMPARDGIARRRSVGGAIMQGATALFAARRRSRSRAGVNATSPPPPMTAEPIESATASPTPPSLSSESAGSATATSPGPATKPGRLNRHLRSASEALRFIAKSRPPPVHANTEPAELPSAHHEGPFNEAAAGLEGVPVIPLSQVSSPEEISSEELKEREVMEGQQGGGDEKDAGTVQDKGKGRVEAVGGRGLTTVDTKRPPPLQLEVVEEPPTPVTPSTPSALMADVTVPPLLLEGIPMLKVSSKKQRQYFFRIDPDQGQIIWHSKKRRISESSAIFYVLLNF